MAGNGLAIQNGDALAAALRVLLDHPDDKREGVDQALKQLAPENVVQGDDAKDFLHNHYGIDLSAAFEDLSPLVVQLVKDSSGDLVPHPNPQQREAFDNIALACICFPFWGCFYW